MFIFFVGVRNVRIKDEDYGRGIFGFYGVYVLCWIY